MRKTTGNTSGLTALMGRRQRGIGMAEVSLAVIVTLSLIALYASLAKQEQDAQYRALIAGEHETILGASRNFVSQNYVDIQLALFDEALNSGQAIMSFTVDDLVAEGYLPNAMGGGSIVNRLYGQDYTLLVRAVDRQDGSEPQATLTSTDLDPTNSGAINPPLLDRDPSNGEMDIEAILATYGGDVLRPVDGGEIVGRLGSSFGGYVMQDGMTSGAYGSFELDITPYSGLAGYPDAGHLASIVALSSFGVIDKDGQGKGGDGVVDPFRRCEGMDIGSLTYAECLQNNEVYTDIVLNNHDSNNDGNADVFPAIRGLTMVQCAQDDSQTGAADSFSINCAQTNISGNLEVSGDEIDLNNLSIREDDVSFHGDQILSHTDIGGSMKNVLSSDRVRMMEVNGGQDLAEAIIDTRVVHSGEEVEKPSCPAKTIDGVSDMSPKIYVYPAAYSEPYGRPIVGVRAYAEDVGSKWRVRLMAFIGQNICSNDVTSAITPGYTPAPNGPVWAPDNPLCSTWIDSETIDVERGNDKADVYELGPDYGAVIAQTRCY